MSDSNQDKHTAEDFSQYRVSINPQLSEISDVSALYDTPRSTRPNSDVSITSSELGHQLRFVIIYQDKVCAIRNGTGQAPSNKNKVKA